MRYISILSVILLSLMVMSSCKSNEDFTEIRVDEKLTDTHLIDSIEEPKRYPNIKFKYSVESEYYNEQVDVILYEDDLIIDNEETVYRFTENETFIYDINGKQMNSSEDITSWYEDEISSKGIGINNIIGKLSIVSKARVETIDNEKMLYIESNYDSGEDYKQEKIWISLKYNIAIRIESYVNEEVLYTIKSEQIEQISDVDDYDFMY